MGHEVFQEPLYDTIRRWNFNTSCVTHFRHHSLADYNCMPEPDENSRANKEQVSQDLDLCKESIVNKRNQRRRPDHSRSTHTEVLLKFTASASTIQPPFEISTVNIRVLLVALSSLVAASVSATAKTHVDLRRGFAATLRSARRDESPQLAPPQVTPFPVVSTPECAKPIPSIFCRHRAMVATAERCSTRLCRSR
jgi:hypothetical protein